MATNILIQTLIVTLLTATCFGQSSLRVDEPQWWFNPQHAPLRFQLPPSKYNLLVTNYSDKTIAKYQLGCVLVTEGSFAKTFNVWPFEKAERLLPATKDNLFFEGIDDKFNNAKICLKGKLAVVSVYFSDGSKYSIQETRNNDLELVMNLGSRDKKISFHAAKEIFARGEKMIPLLIANKGNRDPFAWGSLGDPNGGSITFAPGGNPEWEEQDRDCRCCIYVFDLCNISSEF